MKNKKIIRNICVDIALHALLIMRLFNMENIIINNICRFLPTFLSLISLLMFLSSISFIAAACQPDLKQKLLSDKAFIEAFIEYENDEKIKTYNNITNCTLAGLFILNGFMGCFTLYVIALFLLSYSKQCFRVLLNLPPKADPQIFENFKKKMLQDTSKN